MRRYCTPRLAKNSADRNSVADLSIVEIVHIPAPIAHISVSISGNNSCSKQSLTKRCCAMVHESANTSHPSGFNNRAMAPMSAWHSGSRKRRSARSE